MIGKHESSQCALCGGSFFSGLATLPFLVDERVVVVRRVPAEICHECGEAYMNGAVVDVIEALLDSLEQLSAEVSVISYQAA